MGKYLTIRMHGYYNFLLKVDRYKFFQLFS